ncbi:Stp1/IreP family PP2C-type Ser/Thr phosphatase [Desulfitobacterium sp.]|uniref:Stp1/IreP family PP2C-type Ser/Thr phosphatase n=1 Tax=Desulfitobacterium sp. TaxID=49981 RepID=UPI002B6F3377|nr:Stp1/IreP family PP2C-type Ser/Thr phosphatase [Desulfitobacterium sp.]HVJ50552.1 Stp1/IreP family PP2C-type Ser/Thr phosphatase [Desulfitobacterium sp.]
MKVLSFSETGCVRKNNEDSLLVLPQYGLYAVADGMGGHRAGEVAAHTALEVLAEAAPEIESLEGDAVLAWVKQASIKANRRVFEASTVNPENEGMGTTLTALVFKADQVVIAHVGDSRGYLWRGEKLIPLTVDHSLVEELVRRGQISEEEAEKHPQRHVLVRAVGASQTVEVDSSCLDCQPGDVFLLCTDGFTNVITEQELIQEFSQTGSWEEHFERMRQLILERGAPDNFTALCCIME